MVGGPRRDVTRLMRHVPGLWSRTAPRACRSRRCPTAGRVAVKIADGGGRARTPVTIAALRSLGVDVAADAVVEPILGHGQPVGAVRSLVGAP